MHELIVCGWDEVFVLDMSRVEHGLPTKTWSWRSEDREELPDSMKSKFRTSGLWPTRTSGYITWPAGTPMNHRFRESTP